MSVEEPQSADGNSQRPRRGFFLYPHPLQVRFHIVFSEFTREPSVVKLHQLPHRASIRFPRSFAEPGDHHVAQHSFAVVVHQPVLSRNQIERTSRDSKRTQLNDTALI